MGATRPNTFVIVDVSSDSDTNTEIRCCNGIHRVEYGTGRRSVVERPLEMR